MFGIWLILRLRIIRRGHLPANQM